MRPGSVSTGRTENVPTTDHSNSVERAEDRTVRSSPPARGDDTVVLDPRSFDDDAAEPTVVRSEFASPELPDETRCGFIPGYSIVGRLGEGGMGIVYQAIQERLQRAVALKVLTPRHATNPDFVARFKREAMAIARLNHPNIVTAYDYGECEGRFWMALEYIEGMDCEQLAAMRGKVPLEEVLDIAREAVLGLSHALNCGIIHRDVKPANLMIVPERRDASFAMNGRVKVTDLGLARITENSRAMESEKTQLGVIVGTPCYMAPEQARGEEVDFRADIYSLGATLYRLITGDDPHDAPTAIEALRRKADERIAHPRDFVPDIDPELVLVLDRMMARSPDARYQSYEELLYDIEAVRSGVRPSTAEVPPGETSFEPARAPLRQGWRTRLPEAADLLDVILPSPDEPAFVTAMRIAVPLVAGFALALMLRR